MQIQIRPEEFSNPTEALLSDKLINNYNAIQRGVVQMMTLMKYNKCILHFRSTPKNIKKEI